MKKHIFICIAVIFTALLLTSCSSTKNAGDEYSPRTVIVTLAPDSPDGTAALLAADFDLEVVYDYKSFTMCALAAKRDLSHDEMQDLIARLQADKRVLAVSRDRIIRLTDPVQSCQ